MYSIETGFFPVAGLTAAGLFYAAYHSLVRFRCTANWAQAFIVMSVVLATMLTLVSPVKIVETQPEVTYVLEVPVPTQTAAVTDVAKEIMPAVRATDHDNESSEAVSLSVQPEMPSYSVLLQDASPILGWLYVAGIVVMLLHFSLQFLWHAREQHMNLLLSVTDEACIYATKRLQPFSFGKSIFLPISLSEEIRHMALVHELSHVRHRHFRKLCQLELVLAVNWFNPFVWLFFNEMKLQQELETDADVLATGIDRSRYQMGLLKVAMQHSRWLIVQSFFGTKPIKQRIIFMNKTFDNRNMRRRLMAAAAATAMTLAVTLSAGCQANKQEAPADHADHHDLYGIWSLDFTRPADSQQELYPPFKQYAFYSDDVFFTPHFWSRDGQNLAFGFSGIGLEMRGGQLVDVFGQPINYKFVSDNTFQSTWKKREDDNALVNAELVTDQWSRSTPDSIVMNLFRAACKADQAHSKPLDGIWRSDGDEEEGWMLFNGGIMLTLSYQQTDSTVYKFGGAGFFCTVTYDNDNTIIIGNEKQKFHWEQRDKDHIALTPDNDDIGSMSLLRRTPLPRDISRMLNATLIENP